MSDREKAVLYIIEESPKNQNDWSYVCSCQDGDGAAREIARWRKGKMSLSWDYRLVRVEQTRTVIE
jgi:hypothetical protein